ncbi:hypothetical protein RUM43_005626 [Polyplax serrata]|uniref:Uncharacterized protein n=1 Tax=Polyplax serrata TaxID=468196 RepID=A0AAN8S8P9_POLSC
MDSPHCGQGGQKVIFAGDGGRGLKIRREIFPNVNQILCHAVWDPAGGAAAAAAAAAATAERQKAKTVENI